MGGKISIMRVSLVVMHGLGRDIDQVGMGGGGLCYQVVVKQ